MRLDVRAQSSTVAATVVGETALRDKLGDAGSLFVLLTLLSRPACP